MSNNYYVYAYLDPQGTPFYVGAGHGKRDTKHIWLCQRKKTQKAGPHFIPSYANSFSKASCQLPFV